MNLTVGQPAPDFELPDQTGKIHRLSDFRGQWAFLYFYPEDDTAGCTKEACGVRDRFGEFGKNGLVVLGVSKDSQVSHQKFIAKYSLPFTLLSDESRTVLNLYESWGLKKYMGKEYEGTFRNSFLINPQGSIAKIYEGVKPEDHAGQVLADIAALKIPNAQ